MIDRSPIKVIIDTNLTTPLNCSLVKNANKNGLIIFTSELNNNNNFIKFLDRGVELIKVDTDANGLLNVRSVLDMLREKGFNRILVEGGSTLSSSFLSNNWLILSIGLNLIIKKMIRNLYQMEIRL